MTFIIINGIGLLGVAAFAWGALRLHEAHWRRLGLPPTHHAGTGLPFHSGAREDGGK